MKISNYKLHATLLLALLTLCAGNVSGQGYPPAQGPAVAEEPYRFLPTFLIINTLKNTIQTTLDSTNAKIIRESQSTGINAHLSFDLKTHRPTMTTSQYPDRPNENVVKMAFSVSYDVTGIRYYGVPYFSREIHQSIEVIASCENWFTSQGQMKVVSRAARPYLDSPSFGESVLNFFIANTLTDMVDSKLRQKLPGAVTTISDSLGSCNRLGVTPGTEPNYADGTINYNQATVRRPPIRTTFSEASVTFQSIKRLPARTLRGAMLYNEAEDIQLVLYGNQTMRAIQLSGMWEGEQRSLTADKMALGKLGDNSSVVLICNVEQLSTFQKDTRFLVFTKANNFGNGQQKIVVQKTYWEPPQRLPDGRLTKPIERRVDAYEITAFINAAPPVVRR